MAEPFEVDEEAQQQALIVKLELDEAVRRMRREGLPFNAIMAGIASVANDLIAAEHNQATASAWFLGMAKQAALFAAQELPPELRN